jgi:hypothetical protein
MVPKYRIIKNGFDEYKIEKNIGHFNDEKVWSGEEFWQSFYTEKEAEDALERHLEIQEKLRAPKEVIKVFM